jgi:hypothetical protein
MWTSRQGVVPESHATMIEATPEGPLETPDE